MSGKPRALAVVVALLAAGACSSGSTEEHVGAEPGTYTFASTGTVVLNDQPPMPSASRTLLEVAEPDGGRQRQTRRAVDDNGTGSVIVFDYEYRPDGSYLTGLGIETHLNDVVDVRTFEPEAPVLVLPKDFSIGARTVFHMTESGSGITAEASLTLVREETVSVDGVEVRTMLQEIDVAFGGPLQGTAKLQLWFAPQPSVVVQDAVRADVDAAGVRLHVESAATLTDLEPSDGPD